MGVVFQDTRPHVYIKSEIVTIDLERVWTKVECLESQHPFDKESHFETPTLIQKFRAKFTLDLERRPEEWSN